MKNVFPLIFCFLFAFGCDHPSNNGKVANSDKTTNEKIDYGSTTGEPGGPCNEKILADREVVRKEIRRTTDEIDQLNR